MKNIIVRFIIEFVLGLKAYHIDEFYKVKMQNDGVNAKTVHRYHANIRKALQQAVKLDMIPYNPADKVDLPKARKFRGSYYCPSELQQLFECAKGTKFETVVLLAGYLGVRSVWFAMERYQL